MTTRAQAIIDAYSALPPIERHEVVVDIMRRSAADDIPGVEFHELADELFRRYEAAEAKDAEEAGRAAS